MKRGGNLTFLSLNAKEAEERYAGEPVEESSPANAYERLWAVALIEEALSVLRAEHQAAAKGHIFEALKGFIWGEADSTSYAEIAKSLHLTEAAAKVTVHRLRKRFREVVRSQVAQTVARPEEIDKELRHLIAILSTKEE